MRTAASFIALLALLLCSPAISGTSVLDLNPPSRVTGCLGKPLGTRMTIAGIFDEHVMMANPLEVSETDGKALKNKVSIAIRGKLQIKKGVHYRLEGYEAGEFSGPPPNSESPPAQQPFQYRSFFVVTKVIEPKS
jgi:hypothetical protein